MKTIVTTTMKDETWIATTPHAPDLSFEAVEESKAVTGLIAAIREYTAPGNAEWIAGPKLKRDKNVITRHLSGLWPESFVDPESKTPLEEHQDAN